MRYNHFALNKYNNICFSSVQIGGKFRMDKFKNGKRRAGIIMVKNSDLSYYELKSKKEYTVIHSEFDVQEF